MADQTILSAASPDDVGPLLQQVLNGVAAEFNRCDYRKPLKEKVVPILQAEHEQYFNQESGPLGKWPDLSPLTAKKKGYDTILIETNAMRSSLLFDGPDHVEDVEERYLTWGTSDEKAATHQEGTDIIPQRAFVGVSEKTADDIAAVAAEHVVETLKG